MALSTLKNPYRSNMLAFSERGIGMGALQRSGPMAVMPLFGPDHGPRFMPPLTGLKLSRVAGYGNVEIECRGGFDGGVAIVPLHIGYIQDKAQNHALCRAALLGSGQKRMFEDACCVQQAQGGYLEGREQWFFVLPVELRAKALSLRGQKGYQKLWADIAKLNASLRLPARGHLEQIICSDRYWLTQYASRFELCDGQTGAVFFVDDELVGVEIAPNAAYFREAWMPLVCFSYGVLAKSRERRPAKVEMRPLAGATLDELMASLFERRRTAASATLASLARLAPEREKAAVTEDERYLDLRLSTIEGSRFAGQRVDSASGEMIYLSLFARHLDVAA